MLLARSFFVLPALIVACATSPGEELGDETRAAELSGEYRSELIDSPCAHEDEDAAAARRAIARVRALTGLPMLRCDQAASTAARAHCRYIEWNGGALTHAQERGKKGFTGETFQDRLVAEGFADSPAGEVLATLTSAPSILGSRGYLNSVYHRSFFLRAETVSFGYGASENCSAVEFGRMKDPRAVPAVTVVWPPHGARSVPFAFHAARETPNPVPGSVVVGAPISLIRTTALARIDATLHGPGGLVRTTILAHSNDPNRLVRVGEAHLIPLAALAPNTLYRARFDVGDEIIETSFTTSAD